MKWLRSHVVSEKLNILLDITDVRVLRNRVLGRFAGKLSLLSLRKSLNACMPLAVSMLVYIEQHIIWYMKFFLCLL
jgi:hypothetical protein